jgi:methyl-accepting chemotaxis protein
MENPMDDQHAIIDSGVRTKRPSRLFGQYVIKNRFQFKFSLVIFTFLSVAALTIIWEAHYGVKVLIDANLITSADAIVELNRLNTVIVHTSILALAIVFGLSLFFSHFIAGPIYRFEKTLEEMRSGNLSIQVKLRKHDEFKEVAELFNQALAGLRARVRKEHDAMNAFVEKGRLLSEKLRKDGRVPEADQLDQLLSEIKNTPPQIII